MQATLLITKVISNGTTFYKNAYGKRITKKAATNSIKKFNLKSSGLVKNSNTYQFEIFSGLITVKM